ncbi:MAG: hypothetical protein ACRC3H_00080 [Lachnospiraceae bacterium]
MIGINLKVKKPVKLAFVGVAGAEMHISDQRRMLSANSGVVITEETAYHSANSGV